MVNAYSIGGFVTLNSYGIDKFAYLCKTGTGSNPVSHIILEYNIPKSAQHQVIGEDIV